MLKSGLRILAAMVFMVMPACSHLETPPPAVATAQQTPRLILISIDGFRADYLREGITPNLQALADGGASAAMRR